MNIQDITNELYFYSINEFVTKRVKITDAIQLITYCMELVDKKNISGPQKSEVVKGLVTKLTFQYFDGLKESLSPECISNLNLLVKNNLLQPLMDNIYNASVGRTAISNNNTATNAPYKHYNIELQTWNARLMGF